MKSHPGELIDAIVYGRDLGQEDNFVCEERFDKIRYYLKNGKYPHGADRAEKSRLRSAATHYRLYPSSSTGPERLMLKGKEVISDPKRQYEIARDVHNKSHGGINKTTATIAESFHWVRIKESVSQVIRNCPECSEMNKGLASMRANMQARWMPPPGTPKSTSSTVDSTPPLTQSFVTPSQSQTAERADSPSHQLHLEATQQSANYYGFNSQQHSAFDLPVDPALIGAVNASQNLENLPPSPFLNASQNMDAAQVPNLSLPTQDAPIAKHRMSEDVAMGGTSERASTAREELRRRLARAGYKKQ